MNLFFPYLALLLFSYLLGSIPFSLIFAKLFRGIDVRGAGSGNVGATNVLISTGKKRIAALAVLFDIAKGFGAVVLARIFIGSDASQVLAPMLAIIGHDFSVYLNFSGGKGIATTAGAIIAINPYSFAVCLLVYAVFLALTRYLILSSLLALAAAPLIFFVLKEGWIYILFAITALLIAIYAHRDDMVRMLSGKETTLSSALDRVV